jgi:hypothetical protein
MWLATQLRPLSNIFIFGKPNRDCDTSSFLHEGIAEGKINIAY